MTSQILVGDSLETLRTLESDSVQCCMTSPPYWGLRSYLPDEHPDKGSELGLESTPEEHVAAMVAVFEEVRRVLRPDGTLWLNYGDCYANDGKWGGHTGGKHRKALHGGCGLGRTKTTTGLKPKDLVGMPWRIAFALQAAGWWLRCDVIWQKPAPMPESVSDRPTKSHEYVFLLAKAARYFYDAEAIAEPATEFRKCGRNSRANVDRDVNHGTRKQDAIGNRQYTVFNERYDFENPAATRNARSVWTIPTQAFSEAHFATFPEELAARCVLAGTSEYGACAACGTPWERVVESSGGTWEARKTSGHPMRYGTDNLAIRSMVHVGQGRRDTLGFRPACACGTEERCPCVVLDPFCGSGTTGLVAARYGRSFVGIELNPEYADMARRRIAPALAQPALLEAG